MKTKEKMAYQKIISDRLGHSDTSITLIHICEENKIASANVLDLLQKSIKNSNS